MNPSASAGARYVYGLNNLPIEQVNNSTGTVSYPHHDQAGSTRLITGSTGTVTGKCTYAAYGTPTCEGTATTPLGYDGQYTNSDTGLIPPITRAPYSYADDNPLNDSDRRRCFHCI
jgi:hypothetical protein